jgi:hypothetical protein
VVALFFGGAAPYSVGLASGEREVQAFASDAAPGADGFCLRYLIDGRPGGGFREEQVRIGVPAGRRQAPVPVVGLSGQRQRS